MEYAKFIEGSLEKASIIANQQFGKVTGSVKKEDNNQVLTETDLAIGKLLISEIERDFPKYNIIDEEAGVIDKKSEFTWVVDPIDGTSNFASGTPTYGIFLGLLHKDQPIAGGIALPAFNEIYTGEKGKGALCNGKPVHVTEETDLLNCLVCYQIDGHQNNPELTRKEVQFLGELILRVRNLRTANSAFDAVMLVKGAYGGFLNGASNKIWDNVAQQIVIEEAGGLYTDFYGKPMDYSNALARIEEVFSFCAAPAQLHSQLQKIIHEHDFR